jgi:hypothetical protein
VVGLKVKLMAAFSLPSAQPACHTCVAELPVFVLPQAHFCTTSPSIIGTAECDQLPLCTLAVLIWTGRQSRAVMEYSVNELHILDSAVKTSLHAASASTNSAMQVYISLQNTFPLPSMQGPAPTMSSGRLHTAPQRPPTCKLSSNDSLQHPGKIVRHSSPITLAKLMFFCGTSRATGGIQDLVEQPT